MNQENKLRQAVEQRKDFLKDELLRMGYFKTPEKKQLYELTLSELENLYITVRCNIGKAMSEED